MNLEQILELTTFNVLELFVHILCPCMIQVVVLIKINIEDNKLFDLVITFINRLN